MSQYTPKKFSKHQIVSPTDLAAEFGKIGTAFGSPTPTTLDATNFPESSRYIPNESLALPNNVVIITLKQSGTVTGAVSYGTEYCAAIIPHGMILKQVTFICTAVTGTVEVRVGGNEQAISAGATAYTITTPYQTQYAPLTDVALEIQAGAGESITNVRCDLVFYSNHILTALPK